MNGFLLPCLAHRIDVAQHFVNALNAILHLFHRRVMDALTQSDNARVLFQLLAQVIYHPSRLLVLQTCVEKESFTLAFNLHFLGFQIPQIVFTRIKRCHVP